MQSTSKNPIYQQDPLAWQRLGEFSLTQFSLAKSEPRNTLSEVEIAAQLRAGGLLQVFQALGVPPGELEWLVARLAQAVRRAPDQPGPGELQPVETICLFCQGRTMGEFQRAAVSNLCVSEASPNPAPPYPEVAGPDRGGWGYFVIRRGTYGIEKVIEFYLYREDGSPFLSWPRASP